MFLPDIRFCSAEHLALILEVDKTSPYPWPDRVIAADLSRGGFTYLGAFSAWDKLLGYAVLGDEDGEALLMNLVVAPQYRRRGVGMQLLAAIAECAAERSFKKLNLRVRISNTSGIALYEAMGFKQRKLCEGYYSNGEAALCMAIRLPLVFEDTES